MKIHRLIVPAVVLALSAMALLAQSGAILATGTFHGIVHKTSGRATVYQTTGGTYFVLHLLPRQTVQICTSCSSRPPMRRTTRTFLQRRLNG